MQSDKKDKFDVPKLNILSIQNEANSHVHSETCNHNHYHSHSEFSANKLLWISVFNVIITFAQFIGGILSNSLALVSDALHNLSDASALVLSYFSLKISKSSSTNTKTYGFKRAQIISAFVNSLVLVAISFYLIYESIHRFFNPSNISTNIMIGVGFIGLIWNLISVFFLHSHKDSNLNIKAAYLHLVGDVLGSVAVIVGALFVRYFGALWVDPLITFIFSLYIIKETYQVLISTIDILMQSVPHGLDLEKIKNELLAIDGIKNIHHVHIWNLDDSDIHFECHADMQNDLKISEIDTIRSNVENYLKDKYSIDHVTFQAEFDSCQDKRLVFH